MSEKLISLSPDLKRLRDEGYAVEVRHGHLVVHSVPYANSRREVAYGKVVTNLNLNGDQTLPPTDHQVWFSGEHPCNADGSIMKGLGNDPGRRTLCEGVEVDYRFSCKLPGGVQYPDFHAKVTQYIEIISNQARAIDLSVRTRTFEPILSTDDDSVFLYVDTASSRAGTANVSRKLAMQRVAIVGLGGTGSYVLDLIAKTPIREIHLFDGDEFCQHNAFRAPGAASVEELTERLPKVEYFARIYQKMRRGVIPHAEFLSEKNVSRLAGFEFVFLCVDRPAVRGLLSMYLASQSIPFVDAGMELELIEERQCIIGSCRVTTSTTEKSDHFGRHVSTVNGVGDDLYASNIQVADLNALCAVMAVIKWKKLCTFYQDCIGEHHSVYALNAHQLTKEEAANQTPS
jgi:hypothetical protein